MAVYWFSEVNNKTLLHCVPTCSQKKKKKKTPTKIFFKYEYFYLVVLPKLNIQPIFIQHFKFVLKGTKITQNKFVVKLYFVIYLKYLN